MPRSTASFIAIASSSVIALIVLLLLSGMLWTGLHIPYEYQYDALFSEAQIKGMIENGWFLHNSSLGAPAGQSLYDFPLLEMIDNLLIKVLALGFGDFGAIINLLYILSFPLVAATATYACLRMGLRPITSASVGIIYACAPFHFLRFEKHILLSTYFTAPLSLLLLYEISRQRSAAVSVSKRHILLSVVTGLGGLYYSAMSCLLIAISSFLASLNEKKAALLVSGLICCAIAGGTMLCVASPNIGYWLHHGMPRTFERRPDYVERLGLTISQMILPVPHHRVPVFDEVRKTFDTTMLSSLMTENDDATLGLAATLGFLALLMAPFIRPLRNIFRGRMVLSYTVLIALLWATVGGLAASFSLLPFGSVLRSTNRISIFIAFFSLCGLGVLADRLIRRRRCKGIKPLIWAACYVVVVVLAVLDQCPDTFNVPDARVVAHFKSDEALGRYIDASLPDKSMIYNLPYVQFPEGIATGVGDYDEMRPYLHTHHVRYSYGAMRGRGANEWENRVLGAGPNLAPALKQLGFSAILIDNNYCDQSDSTLAQIAQIVKQCHATPIFSPDNSFVFVPIH